MYHFKIKQKRASSQNREDSTLLGVLRCVVQECIQPMSFHLPHALEHRKFLFLHMLTFTHT